MHWEVRRQGLPTTRLPRPAGQNGGNEGRVWQVNISAPRVHAPRLARVIIWPGRVRESRQPRAVLASQVEAVPWSRAKTRGAQVAVFAHRTAAYCWHACSMAARSSGAVSIGTRATPASE